MRLWASLVFVTLLAAFCSYGEAAPREANGVNYSNIIDILFKFGNIRELKKVSLILLPRSILYTGSSPESATGNRVVLF